MSQALLTLFNFVSTLLTHTHSIYVFFFLGVCLKVRHKAAAGARERRPTQYAYKRERARTSDWVRRNHNNSVENSTALPHFIKKQTAHLQPCACASVCVIWLRDSDNALSTVKAPKHSLHSERAREQVESVYRKREGERNCQRAHKRERERESESRRTHDFTHSERACDCRT